MFKIYNINKGGLLTVIFLVLLIVVLAFVLPKIIIQQLYPLKYKELIFKYSDENNIDPYLVTAIMKVESKFNLTAISSKNAKGLMQLSDQTAMWGAEELEIENFSIEDVFDPETNIRIACWYISTLMKEFDYKLQLVLAAYNGGSGNVTKWLKDKKLSSSGEKLDKIPFKETENYVNKVIKEYNIYNKLYRGNRINKNINREAMTIGE